MKIGYRFFKKILNGGIRVSRLLGLSLWKYYMKNNIGIDYDETRTVWETKAVHPRFDNPEEYYNYINKTLNFRKTDVVLDIGCGDGTLDSYLPCKVFGIDVAKAKIEKAKRQNPGGNYLRQSFLDKFKFANSRINKVFSFTVFQYCKPEDADTLLRNSIEALDFRHLSEGMVAHLSIPDIEIAWLWYMREFGIKEEDVKKNIEMVRYAFPEDGSYWHNLEDLSNRCERVIDSLNIKEFGHKIMITKSESFYRHNLVIYFWRKEVGKINESV